MKTKIKPTLAINEAFGRFQGRRTKVLTRKEMKQTVKEATNSKLFLVAEAVVGKTPKHKGGWHQVKNLSQWQSEQRMKEDQHRNFQST